MKYKVLCLFVIVQFVFLLVGGSVYAGQYTIEELQASLNLTDQQVEQLMPIIEQDKLDKQAIIDRYSDQGQEGMQAMREELKALQTEHDKKYSEFLTPQQMGDYKQLRQQSGTERRIQNFNHRRTTSGNPTGSSTSSTQRSRARQRRLNRFRRTE